MYYSFSTWSWVPVLVPYYAMAVLVQHPGTNAYRIVLLPLIYQLSLTSVTAIDREIATSPSFVSAPAMLVIAMRTSAWVLNNQHLRRDFGGFPTCSASSESPPLKRTLWDALDLMVNLRNVGWVPGGKPRFHTKPLGATRTPFLLMAALQIFIWSLAFDLAIALLHYLRPDGLPPGSTIFEDSQPLALSYLRAVLLTYTALFLGFAFMSLLYSCVAFLGVLVLRQIPEQWPPLFDAPWQSTSLQEFWSQRWHQLFRELFVSLGSRPANRIVGRPFGILGAFLVSGALHDVRLRKMGEGVDSRVTYGFFVFHGLAIAAEVEWKKRVKRDVGGWVGWVWIIVACTGSSCIYINGFVKAGLLETGQVRRISGIFFNSHI